ncbi:MAG TPA: outer membrane protein assembly factor BamD [Steroidobacteraceae bacterium]|jgi:outer membrane protein assembly factor BamD|nr:outer membrane protein assembly factor BamD [Steroidobacteraceae bacterium]
MLLPGLARGSVVALCVVLLATAGCRTHRASAEQKVTPEVLFKRAKKDLENNNFNGAIKSYEALTARFPFADEARQAHIDLIYAYYRAGEGESATDAADTFIRENPTHPRVDYAYYVKGLVDFERTPNAIERVFRADLTKRPPSTARKAFAAFKVVVEQYPKSEYAHDALQRMVYLRDRLASYEVHVAQYYLKRGAYVAAAQRAKGAIEQYDGAPAERDALTIMIECYDKLGLKPLADQAREVYAANYSGQVRPSQAAVRRAWWKFW